MERSGALHVKEVGLRKPIGYVQRPKVNWTISVSVYSMSIKRAGSEEFPVLSGPSYQSQRQGERVASMSQFMTGGRRWRLRAVLSWKRRPVALFSRTCPLA